MIDDESGDYERDGLRSVIITCTNILLFLEICLFLLIEWMFGDIVFDFLFVFEFSVFMLCFSFNLLMAFDRLLLKGIYPLSCKITAQSLMPSVL